LKGEGRGKVQGQELSRRARRGTKVTEGRIKRKELFVKHDVEYFNINKKSFL